MVIVIIDDSLRGWAVNGVLRNLNKNGFSIWRESKIEMRWDCDL